MLDTSVWLLPEIEQALISALQDIKRFELDLYETDENAIKYLQKSLLYKAHHHLQLCETHLNSSKIPVPSQYLSSILSCLEILQENNTISLNHTTSIIKSIQSLVEYINHGLILNNLELMQKQSVYLYYPYTNLLKAFNTYYQLPLEKFINFKINLTNIDISTPYYAKYDIFLLKKLKDNITIIKDKWAYTQEIIEYVKQCILIIKTVEWYEILPIMQTTLNYIEQNTSNADLEVASALLFLEYIIGEPWREYEITKPYTTYTLAEICQAIVLQIENPNTNNQVDQVDLNILHQRVHNHSIRKSVLYQINLLIEQAKQFITTDINQSAEIIYQVMNILSTIGFVDKNNLLSELHDKLKSYTNSLFLSNEINSLYYVFSTLDKYIQSNYPDDIHNENNALQQNNENNVGKSSFSNIENELLLTFNLERTELINEIFNSKNIWQYSVDDNLVEVKNNILNLRRCFHTLKSSFRMLNMEAHAKASSALEHLFNRYLNKEPIDKTKLINLIEDACKGFIINEDNEYLNKIIQPIINENTAPILNDIIENKNDKKESVTTNKYFNKNLIIIYIKEAKQILQDIEHALEFWNSKELTKLIHKLDGSSSTSKCKCVKDWCYLFSHALEYYLKNNIEPQTHILSLIQYTLYSIKDSLDTINETNIAQDIDATTNILFEQINKEIKQEINLIQKNQQKQQDIKNISIEKDAINAITTQQLADENKIIDGDNELVNLFCEEAQSLHTIVRENLHFLYNNDEATKEVLRALHTLKGGARMVGFLELGDLYHNLEEMINNNINIEIVEKNLNNLLEKFEYLCGQNLLGLININKTNSSPSQTSNTIKKPDVEADKLDKEKPWYVKVDNQKLSTFIEKTYHIEGYIAKIGEQIKELTSQLKSTFTPLHQINQLLNQLTLQEHKRTQNTKKMMTNIQNNMDSLEFDVFSTLQIQLNQSQNVNNAIIAQQEYLLECLYKLTDDFNALQIHTSDIQTELSHLSLLSFSQINAKLHQTCQQVAKEQQKQVKLSIAGETIQVSKTILEGLSFAFEHLIRNSIKHGIETPQIRIQNGKNEVGNIKINIHQHGEYMNIIFTDDGQGINKEAIIARATEKGWLKQNEETSFEQLINFIIQPGFSTASEVSQTAGRGIGLDTVVAYLKNIGGEITINSTQGQGFYVHMSLPLTSFISEALICRIGNYTFGLLLNNISGVKSSLNNDDINLDANIDFSNSIPMFNLLGQAFKGEHNKHISFNYHNENYYIGIDEIIASKDLYIKKNTLPYVNEGMIGISIINFNEILPIYNLDILFKNYLQSDNSITYIADNSFKNSHKHIMIVDDSSTLRFTTQRILKKYNYEVTLAIDGIEALEKIKNIKPIDLFLVDIEMPRMDGFQLIQEIRNLELYKDTPIIVISSRQIEKYQEKVYELGANDFLGKPYQTDQLISHVTRELAKAHRLKVIKH